jgi:ERF superfamily
MNTQAKPHVVEPMVAMPNNLPATYEPKQVAPPRAIYPPKLAKAIIAVTKEVGRIQKDGTNKYQQYQYATWENIVDKLSPLLAEHAIIINQSEVSRNLIEDNEKGSTLAVVYNFTIVNDEGDCWPDITWTALCRLRDGKGVTDDKAAAKCHTQAEKYFCIKQFKIRTNDRIDSDAGPPEPHMGEVQQTPPQGRLPAAKASDLYRTLEREVDELTTQEAINAWLDAASPRLLLIPVTWEKQIRVRALENVKAIMGDGAKPDPVVHAIDRKPHAVPRLPEGDTEIKWAQRYVTAIAPVNDVSEFARWIDLNKKTIDRCLKVEDARAIIDPAHTAVRRQIKEAMPEDTPKPAVTFGDNPEAFVQNALLRLDQAETIEALDLVWDRDISPVEIQIPQPALDRLYQHYRHCREAMKP